MSWICFVEESVLGVREGVVMAVLIEAVGGGAGREFLSPLRILVRSFRLSRDQWKAKAGRMKAEVKRLKVNVHDVQLSRAAWRERAEVAEGELAALRLRMAAMTETPARQAEAPLAQKKRRVTSASR